MRSLVADRVVSLFLFDLSGFELLCRLIWTLDNGNARLRHSLLELHLLLLGKTVLPGPITRLYTSLAQLFLVFSLVASA
jgi:hypothetical protein